MTVRARRPAGVLLFVERPACRPLALQLLFPEDVAAQYNLIFRSGRERDEFADLCLREAQRWQDRADDEQEHGAGDHDREVAATLATLSEQVASIQHRLARGGLLKS